MLDSLTWLARVVQISARLGNHARTAKEKLRQHSMLEGFSGDPLGFFDFLMEAQLQDIRCVLVILPTAWSLLICCTHRQAAVVYTLPRARQPCRHGIFRSTFGLCEFLMNAQPDVRCELVLCTMRGASCLHLADTRAVAAALLVRPAGVKRSIPTSS